MNQKLVSFLIVVSIISILAFFPDNGKSDANSGTEQTLPKAKLTKMTNSENSRAKPKDNKRENKFNIEIINIEESGPLSRTVTAKLVNNDGYAKNVKVTLELLLDNHRVKVNGKDALTIVVGDMDAKSSVQREVEISVSFLDGLKIRNKGYLDAKLTVRWDGGKEIFKKRIKI